MLVYLSKKCCRCNPGRKAGPSLRPSERALPLVLVPVMRGMCVVCSAMACRVCGAMGTCLMHGLALRLDGVARALRLGPADGAGGLAGLQLLYDPAKQAPHAGVVHEAGSAPAADQLVVRTIDVRNAQNLQQKTGKQGCLLYLAMVCMLLT